MTPPGLRERKKQKTRWAIQEHALRLFAEQGYDATTVDQIAAAAEISPSTFFRYFKTKEDVVLEDEYDGLLEAAFLAAPPELSPLAAIRLVVRQMFSALTDDDMAKMVERQRLTRAVPALRARTADNMLGMIEMMRTAMATRTGRDRDDLDLRAFVGAVVGTLIAMSMLLDDVIRADAAGADAAPAVPADAVADLLDRALANLEPGLPG
jgi:AcrR family transcriptional regulator